MKTQRWRNEKNKRRILLQFDVRKVAAVLKVALLKMTRNSQPVVSGLQRQMDVLARLQFDDGEPAGLRDCKNVQDAALCRRFCEKLRIHESWVEARIDASYLAADNGLQPAFWLRTIQRVTHVRCLRMPVNLQIVQHLFELALR